MCSLVCISAKLSFWNLDSCAQRVRFSLQYLADGKWRVLAIGKSEATMAICSHDSGCCVAAQQMANNVVIFRFTAPDLYRQLVTVLSSRLAVVHGLSTGSEQFWIPDRTHSRPSYLACGLLFINRNKQTLTPLTAPGEMELSHFNFRHGRVHPIKSRNSVPDIHHLTIRSTWRASSMVCLPRPICVTQPATENIAIRVVSAGIATVRRLTRRVLGWGLAWESPLVMVYFYYIALSPRFTLLSPLIMVLAL